MRTFSLVLIFWSTMIVLMGITGYGVSQSGSLDMQDPTLSLIAPNTGETWYSDRVEDILWYAGDTNLELNSIYLWYSIDDGVSFQNIAESIPNTLTYAWQIPQTSSLNARIRIRVNDTFGNQALDESCVPFIISSSMQAPQGLSIMQVNGADVLLNWQPVTQCNDGTPVTPDGYMVLCSPDPNDNVAEFTILGITSGLNFLHQQALTLNNNLFYVIKAYLDSDEPLDGVYYDQQTDIELYPQQLIRKESLSDQMRGIK